MFGVSVRFIFYQDRTDIAGGVEVSTKFFHSLRKREL